MILECGKRQLDLTTPAVMGVLNVTPDSFFDGGRYFDHAAALARANEMIAEGATILDVGGESTRPGASEVSVAEELRRILPIIAAIATTSALVSIDTSKPEVMREAAAAGACIINDVRGLESPAALSAVAETSAAACIMHMQGRPSTMQAAPQYHNVVVEVRDYLQGRMQACQRAGIAFDRLMLDPGIGFGKTLQHNLALLANLPELAALRLPLLIGVSRKSLIGAVLNRPMGDRLFGGLALASGAVLGGAHVIRTHDVAATVEAVRLATALRDAGFVSSPIKATAANV